MAQDEPLPNAEPTPEPGPNTVPTPEPDNALDAERAEATAEPAPEAAAGGTADAAAPPPPYAPYPPAPPYYWQPPKPGTNGFAVAALVVGIVGLFFCFGFLGVVFGHIAKRQIEQTGQAGRGLATAGIVLGWIALGLTALQASSYGTGGMG